MNSSGYRVVPMVSKEGRERKRREEEDEEITMCNREMEDAK